MARERNAIMKGDERLDIINSYISISFCTFGLLPLCWSIDHIVRTLKSYGSDEIERKTIMLNSMNADERSTFLQMIKQQHAGKSNKFFSTRTSQDFDQIRFPEQFESSFDDLQSYVKDEGLLPYCKYHNSGRRFFNTVMKVTNMPWMLRCISEMDNNQKQALLSNIVENYTVGLSSSENSKRLHTLLSQETQTIEQKIASLNDFIRSTNNSNKTMLKLIEKEITHIIAPAVIAEVSPVNISLASSEHDQNLNINGVNTDNPVTARMI